MPLNSNQNSEAKVMTDSLARRVELQTKFQQGFSFHQSGQLSQAQALYEEILKENPRHGDALHLLGVLAAQAMDYQRAINLIEKAIEIHPESAVLYFNRGNALQELKHFGAAIASYDEAIALQSDYAEAQSNRCNALMELRQLDEALARYNKMIALQPYLPEFPEISKGIRKGRNVYEGYQRGKGLQFTNLREKILADPLFKEAYAVARDRTIVDVMCMMNIFLIMRFYLDKIPRGHIVEYGSYRGGNAIFMAYVVSKLYPGMRVYAMDSFEGMPQVDKAIDAHDTGDFSNTDLDELQARANVLKLDNLVLVKGFFEATNDDVMARAEKISFAYIDCDIASSVKYSYEGVKPFMVDGGYIAFDDATISSCIGATEVVEDLLIRRDGLNSEQIWPHFVFRAFFDQN